jgi:hypothetical protein
MPVEYAMNGWMRFETGECSIALERGGPSHPDAMALCS